jgi:hypothetical protein
MVYVIKLMHTPKIKLTGAYNIINFIINAQKLIILPKIDHNSMSA